jgi:hypothetical protein
MPIASRPLPPRQCRRRRRPGLPPRVESLDGRMLFAISVLLDYSFDDNDFFDTPDKRAILQAAANTAVAAFDDDLEAILPTGGNTWRAIIDDPASGGTQEIANLTVPSDTLVVYAGGREMSALGIGGPGGFSSTGAPSWNDRVATRGQDDARGSSATDFGPWGGSITFDTNPSGGWYFGLDGGAIGGRSDFFSVALHEMTHLLGFGTSDAWQSRVSGALFTGPASAGEYDGAGNVPLSNDRAHWAAGTDDDGREAAMDPDLTTGTRKTLTALDLAGMDDVGWELPLDADLTTPSSAPTAGQAGVTFTVTYTHYTDVDVATLGAGDVTVSGPNGFAAPATLVSAGPAGKSVTATYSVAAPGGSFDGGDSGSYSVVLAAGAVGDRFGNFAPGGALGSFAVDIAGPPAASLVAQDVTQFGAATHEVSVTYSDPQGVDASSIDPADLAVTRDGDGLALGVSAVSIAGGGVGNTSPRTAIYTLAAPGGSWDPGDNGTYTVVLQGQQVKDAQGTSGDAGTLGTFAVTVGADGFSAGDVATFTDASGDVVTISLKGPGTGQLMFGAGEAADAGIIVLNGTSPASTLTVTAAGAGTSVGNVTVNGPLKSLTGKHVDLAGTLAVAGTLPKLLLRNATGSITIGPGGVATAVTLAHARDLSITSGSALRSVKAAEWLDTDTTADTITTPVLTALAVKGALEAGVRADSIGKVTAGGALRNADLRTVGNIGSVTVASAADSFVFAGVRADLFALPDSLDDFANPAATLRSFTVKGKAATFSNTRVAAPAVGKAVLGGATIGTTAGNPFGLAADRLTSVVGSTSVNGPYKLSKRDEPGSGVGLIDFAVLVL